MTEVIQIVAFGVLAVLSVVACIGWTREARDLREVNNMLGLKENSPMSATRHKIRRMKGLLELLAFYQKTMQNFYGTLTDCRDVLEED